MHAGQFRLNSEIELRHWWFVARRTILCDLVRRALPPGQGALVIDIGCGTGGNIAALAGEYACVGIDPSREAIELARGRFPALEFRQGEAPDDLGELLERARLVMLNDVLEHAPDDFALLSRLVARTRPGTLFLLTVPADMSLWSPHDVSHGHYRRYDRERLERVWRGMPLEPLLLSHFNSRLYGVVRAARALNRLLGRASGAADTDLRMPASWLNRGLERLFAGERHVLARALDGKHPGYRRGVSCIGLLRRGEGALVPFVRPPDVAPDLHGPEIDGPSAAKSSAGER